MTVCPFGKQRSSSISSFAILRIEQQLPEVGLSYHTDFILSRCYPLITTLSLIQPEADVMDNRKNDPWYECGKTSIDQAPLNERKYRG